MYEQNCQPLRDGDASVVFAEQLAAIRSAAAQVPKAELAPESVVRWANKANQPHFAAICRRLLLPGSRIQGLAHLEALVGLAREEHPCLLCLNHRSNLDVPTLFTLLTDQADPDLFHRIIWIAGRKLEEDVGPTRLLVQCFNRVVVTPHTWFAKQHSEEQTHQARMINIAAERALARLRKEGWVCALFPAGTRMRTDKESTQRAVDETAGYVRLFRYMVLCHIHGCTMPVAKDSDLTREIPRLDRVIYNFGPVLRAEEWLAASATRFPELDHRLACVRAMTEDLESLAPSNDLPEP